MKNNLKKDIFMHTHALIHTQIHIYIYIKQSLCCTLKTQHFKLTIPQIKKRMLFNKTLCSSDYFPLVIFSERKIAGGFTGRSGIKLVAPFYLLDNR